MDEEMEKVLQENKDLVLRLNKAIKNISAIYYLMMLIVLIMVLLLVKSFGWI